MTRSILKAVTTFKVLYDGRLRGSVRCGSARQAQSLAKTLGGRAQGPSVHVEGDGLLRLAMAVEGPPGALNALQVYRRTLPGRGKRLESPDYERKVALAQQFLWWMDKAGWTVLGL